MESTFAAAGRSRNNNFDFLRLALALTVLISHCYPLTQGNNDREPLSRLTGGNEDLGRVAVAGFFILSGFLIANSWAGSRGLVDFLRRRALRIYPGFIAAVLFTSFVIGPFAMSEGFPVGLVIKRVLRGIVTVNDPWLPGIFMHNPMPGWPNGSLWTIWFELVCYLMIAALGVLGLICKPRVVLGCFLFAFVLFMTADVVSTKPPNHWAAPIGSLFVKKMEWFKGPRLFLFFLAGSCFWAFRDRIPKSNALAVLCIAGLIAASLAGRFALHAALPVLGVYLLLWIAFNDSIPLHRFGKYGDFSYGLYLYAFPVTQSLVCLTHARFPPSVLALFVLAVTVPLAIASWFLIERPFLRLKHKPLPAPLREIEAPVAVR
jgi:peptidoglycan/LPS O-acetylase OafA/YrhL